MLESLLCQKRQAGALTDPLISPRKKVLMGPRESLQFGHERQSGEEDVRNAGNTRKIKQTAFERGPALGAGHCVAVIFLKGFLFYLFFFFSPEGVVQSLGFGWGWRQTPAASWDARLWSYFSALPGGGGGGEHRDIAKFRVRWGEGGGRRKSGEGEGRRKVEGGIQLLLFALASEEQTQECLEFGSHQSFKDPDLGRLCS